MGSSGSSTVKRQRRTNAQLAEVDDVIVEVVEAEHPVTLRGVYYRVVSAGAVDKTENAYRLIGRRLLALRRDGSIPYSSITDGTRWTTKPDSWSNMDEALDIMSASYRRALWEDQRVEVMMFTEKDAISGVVLPVTEEWDVGLGVLRGYVSETFAHGVAEEIKGTGKRVFVYQLGDHDPSGVDAWRDFQAKITGFLDAGKWVRQLVHFERLAVTEAQIAEYELPTRPTKSSDTRARGFTGGSVEVDAIPPTVLRAIVRQAIEQHIDDDALRLTRMVEEQERQGLLRLRGYPNE